MTSEVSSSLYVGRSRGLVTICHHRGGKSPSFRAGGKASVLGPSAGVSSCSCLTWKGSKKEQLEKEGDCGVHCSEVSALLLSSCHITHYLSLTAEGSGFLYIPASLVHTHLNSEKAFSKPFPFLKQQS